MQDQLSELRNSLLNDGAPVDPAGTNPVDVALKAAIGSSAPPVGSALDKAIRSAAGQVAADAVST